MAPASPGNAPNVSFASSQRMGDYGVPPSRAQTCSVTLRPSAGLTLLKVELGVPLPGGPKPQSLCPTGIGQPRRPLPIHPGKPATAGRPGRPSLKAAAARSTSPRRSCSSTRDPAEVQVLSTAPHPRPRQASREQTFSAKSANSTTQHDCKMAWPPSPASLRPWRGCGDTSPHRTPGRPASVSRRPETRPSGDIRLPSWPVGRWPTGPPSPPCAGRRYSLRRSGRSRPLHNLLDTRRPSASPAPPPAPRRVARGSPGASGWRCSPPAAG